MNGEGSGHYSWIWQIVSVVVVVALFSLLFGWNGSKNLAYSSDNESLDISCQDYTINLAYDDIRKVTLQDTLDVGTATTGELDGNYRYGGYENEEFGDYTLCINIKTKSYIVVETKKRQTIVFNCADEDDTEALYEGLLAVI